jgi:hypothetical protein
MMQGEWRKSAAGTNKKIETFSFSLSGWMKHETQNSSPC